MLKKYFLSCEKNIYTSHEIIKIKNETTYIYKNNHVIYLNQF